MELLGVCLRYTQSAWLEFKQFKLIMRKRFDWLTIFRPDACLFKYQAGRNFTEKHIRISNTQVKAYDYISLFFLMVN